MTTKFKLTRHRLECAIAGLSMIRRCDFEHRPVLFVGRAGDCPACSNVNRIIGLENELEAAEHRIECLEGEHSWFRS